MLLTATGEGRDERPPVRLRGLQQRDERAPFFPERAVKRLFPVEVIGEAIVVFVQVAGISVVVPGRGHEKRRAEQRRGLCCIGTDGR